MKRSRKKGSAAEQERKRERERGGIRREKGEEGEGERRAGESFIELEGRGES